MWCPTWPRRRPATSPVPSWRSTVAGPPSDFSLRHDRHQHPRITDPESSPTMSNELLALSYDTSDAARIAQFWAQVLNRPITEGATAQFAAIGVTDAAATGLRLMFHQVPEGKVVKNRLHLDITTDDLDAETDRLLGLGATVLNRASTT